MICCAFAGERRPPLPMERLIVVRGPMGAGKTTLCQVLLPYLQPAFWLDGDWCWKMEPFTADEAMREMVMENISFLLGQFLRVAVELVAVVLDADVQSWPAYIGPTQVLPPGDARQLAHVDRFVQYRLRKSCSAATHRKGEVQGKRGLPDRIGVLADEVKVAKGAGGVALVLASPQVAPDLDDAGNGRNPVDNVLVLTRM